MSTPNRKQAASTTLFAIQPVIDPCMYYNNACQQLFGTPQPLSVFELAGNEWGAQAIINGGGLKVIIGQGQGSSKQAAKDWAAYWAYCYLRNNYPWANLQEITLS
ncbi:hypothetical protein FA15DRAFT_598183 [Coprinopsis marcescibilis]|uniref:DRBM domain-containing protein n=1 Tax=Coprinopsis marcescibilis TaxID=230819 RepID=A0A5C3KLL5_COPMA|nr:hypothetical protein FA15DRAFT_598183 [Coprinopsis marcescibilis]